MELGAARVVTESRSQAPRDEVSAADEEDYEEPDYSVDDLEPMPLAQKVVLILVIAAVVIAGFMVFNYYTGTFDFGPTRDSVDAKLAAQQDAATPASTAVEAGSAA